MRSISVFCLLCTAALTQSAEIDIEGAEGGEVSFVCRHKLSSKNSKYFCRDPCKSSEDVLVRVEPNGEAKSGRITAKDSGTGFFSVNIQHLELADARLYWCAVDRSLFLTYTSVNITVHKVVRSSPVPVVTSTWARSVTSQKEPSNSTANFVTKGNLTVGSEQSVSYRSMLYTAFGTAALLFIFILATRVRKCKGVSKPEVQYYNQDPGGFTANKVASAPECCTPVPTYENFPFPRAPSSGCRRPPVEPQSGSEGNSRIYVTPLPHIESPPCVSASVPPHQTPTPRWFGLDASQMGQSSFPS